MKRSLILMALLATAGACADAPEPLTFERAPVLDTEAETEAILAAASAGLHAGSLAMVGVLNEGRTATSAIVLYNAGELQGRYRFRLHGDAWVRGDKVAEPQRNVLPTSTKPSLSSAYFTYPIAKLSLYYGGTESLYHTASTLPGTYVVMGSSWDLYGSGGFSGGSAWTNGQDTLYRANFVRWDFRNTSRFDIGMKTSTSPSTSFAVAPNVYADWVRLTYKVVQEYVRPLLSVTISGPTSIASAGTHQWTASASGGGTGGYSYVWHVSTDGGAMWTSACSGATCSRQVNQGDPSFHIRVTTTDASANTAQAQQAVSVNIDSSIPPLFSSISGPSTVNSGETCMWTAQASGGVAPYSYSWSAMVSGSGEYFSYAPASSGYIYLTVSDAQGRTHQSSFYVSVDPSGSQPVCPI